VLFYFSKFRSSGRAGRAEICLAVGHSRPAFAHGGAAVEKSRPAVVDSPPAFTVGAPAASAGFYESATGKKYPRVQLLTIEGLLDKTQHAEHPDHAPDLNFKKAKAEANAAQKVLI
jgi:hypothetical protein